MAEIFASIGGLIDGSPLQEGALWALGSIPGFPPIIQTVHILGIAVLMGSAVLLNLRLLGLAVPSQGITEMTNRVMPWFWWALCCNLISGAFFVFGRPNRYFNNPVFVWKMGFLIPVVALALLFYLVNRKRQGYWEVPEKRWAARAIALLSLGLWVLVAFAGRWIAYLEYLQYPMWSYEAFDAGPQSDFLVAVENWPIAQAIAATNWFPLLETLHVIAIALLIGSILWVDLRLLGLAAGRYPVTTLSRELIPWSWGAFAVATVTGLGMFITRAASHVENPAFQWKILLLALAGVNMLVFHRRVYPLVEAWDAAARPPAQVRLFGASSLILWSGVTLAGRWVGHIV